MTVLKAHWRPFVLVVLTIAFLYPALNNGWVNWDDEYYVGRNPAVLGLSGENVLKLFSPEHRSLDNYTPFTLVGYSVQHALWGRNAFGYHAVSLLLHLLCSLAVFGFVKRLTEQENLSFVVALLFALHPMHVESVAWISDQKDLWCTLFVLLSLSQYLKYLAVDADRKAWMKSKSLHFSFLFFGLALLSKPAAIPLPLLLFGLDWVHRRKRSLGIAVEKIHFLAASISIFILSMTLADPGIAGFSFGDKIFISAKSLSMYSTMLVVPYSQSCLHPMIASPAEMTASFYWALPVLFAVYGSFIWWSRKHRILFFSLLFFGVLLFIYLPLVKVHDAIIFDRYVYLSSVGFLLFVCLGIRTLLHAKGWGNDRLIFGVGIVVALCFGAISFTWTGTWKNDFTLFSNVAQQYPDHYLAHARLAYHHLQNEEFEQAMKEYDLSIAANPSEYETHYNRGMLQIRFGKTDAAFNDFSSAIQLNPSYFNAYVNRAYVCLNTDRLEQALDDLNRAEAINGNDVLVYHNRGLVHERLNHPKAALNDLRKAQQLDPQNSYLLTDLGRLENLNGNYNEAIMHLTQALQINPKYGPAYYFRSLTQVNLGNRSAALQDALQAMQVGFKVSDEYLEQLR